MRKRAAAEAPQRRMTSSRRGTGKMDTRHRAEGTHRARALALLEGRCLGRHRRGIVVIVSWLGPMRDTSTHALAHTRACETTLDIHRCECDLLLECCRKPCDTHGHRTTRHPMGRGQTILTVDSRQQRARHHRRRCRWSPSTRRATHTMLKTQQTATQRPTYDTATANQRGVRYGRVRHPHAESI
jgi:hypothetical protein